MWSRREFFASLPAGAAALLAVGGCATSLPPAGPAPLTLEEFLRLSRLLTGVDDLDRDTARIYLDAFQTRDGPLLAQLYERAGLRSATPPPDLRDPRAAQALRAKPFRGLVARVVDCWYSGVCETPDGPRVAAFTDALCWSTLAFTKAPGVCGGATGYWADPPRA